MCLTRLVLTHQPFCFPAPLPFSTLWGRFQHYEALGLKLLKAWLDQAPSGEALPGTLMAMHQRLGPAVAGLPSMCIDPCASL